MMLRKLALTIPLSLLMLLSVTVDVFAQRSLKSIRDFSYLHAESRTKQQRIEDFVEDLKKGNRIAFKYVKYDVLEAAIVKLKREADQYRTTRTLRDNRVMRYLLDTTASDQERAFQTLVRAILPGIFNMDPRIRLVATDWLRGLRPDASMQRAVKLAIGVDINVIRYDHRKNQFVFTHPRILETVASGYEYYREKDIDWPTSFQTGGDGTNNDTKKIFSEAPQLRDGSAPENITTGLNARRWGDYAPRYNRDKGYGMISAEEQAKLEEYYKKILEEAELEAQKKYGGDVIALPLERYRKYPKEGTADEEGKRKGAQLLFEQYAQSQNKDRIPLGQGRRYVYLNRECQLVLSTPWAELTKLDEYITRTVWWDKIRKGQKQVMTFISKDTFSTFYRSIDGEMPERIPMLSLATSRPMINANETAKVVDVLITGLHKNKVLSNKYVIIRGLKDIYVDRFGKLETTDALREKINIALWEFKREANRLDLQAGRDVVAESITLGKRPADDWVPIKPVGAGVKTQLDLVDYGFKRPNDEIIAASFRLITDFANSDGAANQEAKDCIDDLFNARFFSFRRPDNTFVTWYGSQAEWKSQYDKLTNGQPCFDMSKANPHLITSDWIFNYDQMKKAQALIDAILSGDPDLLRTAWWSDVESALILTLKRVQLKYAAAGANPTTITFFDQLRKQDVIVNVPEAKTDKTLREKKFADEKALAQGDRFKNNTYSDEKRESIKQSALGGLFNKDPRIRLTSIHFLRRLGPDESMLEAVTTARSIMANVDSEKVQPETTDNLYRFIDTNVYKRIEDGDLSVAAAGNAGAVACQDVTTGLYLRKCWNRYKGVIPDRDLKDAEKDQVSIILNYGYNVENFEWKHTYTSKLEGKDIPFFGLYQLKSPGEELEKLYKFIQRKRLVTAVKRGDVNAITKLSKADFAILGEFIDDEYQLYVPFVSFHSLSANEAEVKPSKFAIFNADDVKVIKRGVDNSNFLVQKGTAEFLIRFYNFYTGFKINDAVKKEIRDAMYFYKQDDVVVEEFVLAFEGENPDGRSVILAGSNLSQDMNPGGERVYQTLPVGILKDIRNAVLGELEELPESLKGILGILGSRAAKASANLEYDKIPVREKPVNPTGDGNKPTKASGTVDNTTQPASGTTTPAASGTTTPPAAGTTTPPASGSTTTPPPLPPLPPAPSSGGGR